MKKHTVFNPNHIFISLIFILLFFVSCNKDDDDPQDPNTPEIINTISSDIDEGGGTIELEGSSVSIPAAAFEEVNKITLNVLSEYESGFDNRVSEIFQIEGLPDKTNKGITVRLPYTGTLSETSYLAIGQQAWNKSLDSLSMGYNLVEAADSSGFLVATLPAFDDNEQLSGEEVHTRSGQKYSVNIFAITGYINVLSEEGHFKVVTLASNVDEALDLTNYFEDAYTKFKDMGFSYAKRTKWPVKVTIKKLGGEFGAQMNSFFGINYGYIEIDKGVLSDKEDMAVTAGHEFFHIVQSFYDPRGTFSMASRQSPNIWIEEASSTWSEELFSSNANYIPLNFSLNYNFALEGAMNSTGEKASSYGYGMSAFIKFIVDKYGSSKMVEIFEDLRAGKSAFKALDNVVATSVSSVWNTFLEELFTFEIYKGDDFKPVSVFAALISEGNHKYIIKSEADTIVTYHEQLKNLSCEVYGFQFNYKDFSDNAFLEFVQECENYDHLMFFKYKNTTSCELIGREKDTLLLNDLLKIINDGYFIGAVSGHGDLNEPFTAKKEVEAAFRIKVAFDFDYLHFRIKGIGSVEHKREAEGLGDTLFVKEQDFYFDLGQSTAHEGVKNQIINISGNSVNLSGSFTYNDYYSSFTANIEFDDIKNPKNIVLFDFYATNSSDFSSGYEGIQLRDIPFSLVVFDAYENPDYWFQIVGNYDSNLISTSYYSHYTYTDGGFSDLTLLDFQGDGYVTIKFYKDKNK
jgi:hypothetical protein